jgi:hypothetical protein
MPQNDSSGQGVSAPLLSDAPDISTLIATVNATVQRGVMRFASATNRGATITSPVAGMVTYLADVDRWEGYDGTSWVAMATGVSAWTTMSLASGYGHNGNTMGNAQYRIINLFGEQTLMLRGGITATYSGGSPVNAGLILSSILPAAATPTTLRCLAVACSYSSSNNCVIRLDARVDGNLALITETGDTPPWVSLNGVYINL